MREAEDRSQGMGNTIDVAKGHTELVVPFIQDFKASALVIWFDQTLIVTFWN